MTVGPIRRVVLATGLALAAVATVVLYLLPNVTAASFVSVRPVVSCDGRIAPPDRPVGSCSDRLEVSVSIDNGYPLPVTLGFGGHAFEANLTRAEGGPAVWTAVADDAALEQMSDSPDGSGGRAAVVPAGTSRPTLAWPLVVDLRARRLPPGRYDLRVRAYGLDSGPVVLIVGSTTGTGSLGQPW